MCKGKYLLWISSQSANVAQYTATPNSVQTYQLQFRGLPRAEKYLLNVEALSIQGVGPANQLNPVAGANLAEPKAWYPPPIPVTNPATPPYLNSGIGVVSVSGFTSNHNFGNLNTIQSAQTSQTNVVGTINTLQMRLVVQSTSKEAIQSVPLVIDPPNDGNYTVSFNGLDPKRLLVGSQGANAATPTPLGDYMLCLSLQPMSAKEIANFYPLERACH